MSSDSFPAKRGKSNAYSFQHMEDKAGHVDFTKNHRRNPTENQKKVSGRRLGPQAAIWMESSDIGA